MLGKELPYKLDSDLDVDRYESERAFLDEIEDFVSKRAVDLARVREHLGMTAGNSDDGRVDLVVTQQSKYHYAHS